MKKSLPNQGSPATLPPGSGPDITSRHATNKHCSAKNEMYLRTLIAVFALASTCCETRKHQPSKQDSQVSNDALPVKEEAPRIGGQFVHWLPLLKNETDMSDHGHHPNLGSVWFYRENEPRVILGESVELLRISRREQPLESAVVEVYMSLSATPSDKREEAFRQLANQLFGCSPDTTLMDRNVKGAEVLRLRFDGKGRADYDPAMGIIQFCSVEWEGYEHARYGAIPSSNNAEQDVAPNDR